MDRRIDVDESRAPVELPGRLLNEMCAHAREEFPEECCGLILGGTGERYRRLVRCRNEMTQRNRRDPIGHPRDGRAAFYMSVADHMRAQREAEVAGERVTAVYHSHVDADAYLSELDLEYAENPLFPFPDADQVVIAVYAGQVKKLGLFRRDHAGARFAGRPIRSAQP